MVEIFDMFVNIERICQTCQICQIWQIFYLFIKFVKFVEFVKFDKFVTVFYFYLTGGVFLPPPFTDVYGNKRENAM